MADPAPRRSKPKLQLVVPARPEASERFPRSAERLHELRLHGAQPRPPREIPAVSRRTRDHRLIAALPRPAIVGWSFRILGSGDLAVTLKLAFTGLALWCGVRWFIFYGVMSRD